LIKNAQSQWHIFLKNAILATVLHQLTTKEHHEFDTTFSFSSLALALLLVQQKHTAVMEKLQRKTLLYKT